MTIFLETITGDATSFEVYGGLAACVHYLLAAAGDGPSAFRAAAADDQKRALIGATRYIDQQFWQGTATGLVGVDPTTLAFPRSGLTDVAGQPLDATIVPSLVAQAAFEMAALLAADPSAGAATDTGSNVSSLGAGPAQISFFRPSSPADGNATVLPTVVDRLIGRWLAGASAAGGTAPVITGASARSDFRDCRCSGVCACGAGRRDVVWPL